MDNPIEAAARHECAKLLTTRAAQALPPDLADGLVVMAFTLGAAWALDLPHLIEMANAQIDSIKAQNAGTMS